MAEETTLAAPSVTGTDAKATADAKYGQSREPRRRRRREPAPPDDFKDKHEFLEHVRSTLSKDLEADRKNREEAVLDARFHAGDQWEDAIRQRRNASAKPTLTINRLPAFVSQLVGNRRLNDVGIKVAPDHGGVKKVAEVREGLIRNIQKVSRAQWAYDKAFEQAVIGGIGQFQLLLDYAHDDVFEQDIRVAAITNPLSVVWDRTSVEPSGADAGHVFVIDKLPEDEFERRYPRAQGGDFDAQLESTKHGWNTDGGVQVVSYWRMRSETRTVALMQDGSVQDVTELEPDLWYDLVLPGRDGEPMIREVQRKYAQMYLCSANDILAGPYELPIKRVPVFRVPGWEVFIEGDRMRWGLVRFLRDPQRLHNYWRSTIAEKLVGAPKAKWVASNAAVEGREDEWRRSHLSDDPLLVYNGESGAPPIRMPPVDMEAALIQEAGLAAQDIRDISNIHEASLGIQSNEVSGRAIMARQRVGELGSVVYQDNLNIAIEEAGKVINDLIPFVYDSARVVKILGADMQSEEQVPINNEQDPNSIDITLGKYSVSITTGPSYTTRRVEAREEMMAMVNAMPDMMSVAADKIIENQDWPGAEEIARRIRSQLPPGMVSPDDMDERDLQAQQQAQAQAQAQAQLQQAQFELEMAEKQAEIQLKQVEAQLRMVEVEERRAAVAERLAKAQQAEAQAAKALADIERDRLQGALDTVDRLTPQTTA